MLTMAKRLFDKNRGNPTKDNEGPHHDPKHSTALLALTLIKGITAVARLTIGTIMRLGINEVAEARENFLGVKSHETHIRSDKSANKRLGRKVRVLIPLECMQSLDADLGGGRDLLDRDAALFALLA